MPVVADPLLDAGKPIRSTDIKAMRDQIDALTDSLAQVSGDGFYTHFSTRRGYASDEIVDGVTGATRLADGLHYFVDTGAADNWIEQMTSATDWMHYVRLTGEGGICTDVGMRPDKVTLPITFEVRFRGSSLGGGSNVYIGIRDRAVAAPITSYTRGVIVEQNSAANWRLTSDDNATRTLGSDFARPVNSTWTTYKIEYVSAAECNLYIDGSATPTETFTADLPDDGVLHGFFYMKDMGNVDLDYMTFFAGARFPDYS